MNSGKVKIYTVNGFTGNQTQIAKHFGIKRVTLSTRLNKGMSIEEAVNIPVKSINLPKIYTVNGFSGNMSQITKHFSISKDVLRNRLKNGMSIEEAINLPVNHSRGLAKIYSINGFTGNIAQIAEHFGLNYMTLISRLNKGMSIEDAVNIPVNNAKGKGKIYTVNGFSGNIAQIAKHFGVNNKTLATRLRKGMSIEEAVNLPVKPTNKEKIYTVNGFTGNKSQIAEYFGINRGTLNSRLIKGASIEEAVNMPVNNAKGKVKIYTVNGFTGNITQIAKHFNINVETLRVRLKNGMAIEKAISYKR